MADSACEFGGEDSEACGVHMNHHNQMGKQQFHPVDTASRPIARLSTLGLASERIIARQGRDWSRFHVCRQESFSLVTHESHLTRVAEIGYTQQENYIKVSFWLSGKHTTVLDGFGQHEHDRPEVFITCGPQEMLKVDIFHLDTQAAAVAVCVLPAFFRTHMGIEPDDLPEPLRSLVIADVKPRAFLRLPLTVDLAAAARAVLVAPFSLRRDVIYGQAKCVELMCLLIKLMDAHDRNGEHPLSRQEARIHRARELLNGHFAEPITLDQVAKEVGLNRVSLSAGFRRLFSMSVYDYLQKRRMDRAIELLQDPDYTVTRVAEEVGFAHACNFSTAFRGYFGCSPQQARERRPRGVAP
jgi:AraC-like DNA-binding protein